MPAASRPARPPTRPPTTPAYGFAVDSKIGSASRTTATTATPTRSYSWSIALARFGAADREPGGEHAQRQAVAAGHHVEPVLGVDDRGRGEHAERAAGDHQQPGGEAAEPPLEADPEDRQRDRDDEEVAEVGVGEGGAQVAPPFVAERHDQAAEGGDAVGRRLLHEDQARPSRGSRPGSRRGARRRARRRAARRGSGGRSGRRRGFGSSASPRRSSFGARLRSRAPQ